MSDERMPTWFARHGRCFRDRAAAGRALAALLTAYVARHGTIVLALPRGGVPVAFEIARALGAPLDVLLARKLGVPGQEELALGAIAEGGACVFNEELVAELGIGPGQIERIAAREAGEIARQARTFRDGGALPELHGRTVILVDDGLATGATMRAAVEAARAQNPARLIVAVPVAARETVEQLKPLVDELVVDQVPEPLDAIGLWYEDFHPVSDDEVRRLIRKKGEG
jgi:putative phosphoribosyl transferase